jgi:hypothetical protein
MDQVGPATTFVKVAEGPMGTERLRAEARILRRAAHPGVVQLQESGPGPTGAWIVRLVRVPRGDLTMQGPWSLEEVAGYGAAVATTVADLHDLGIVHRRLTPDHLLVDDGGRPVLCGFGQATVTDGPLTGAQKAEDTAALARSIRDRMPSPPPRRVSKILDRAIAAQHRRPLSARQLAAALTVGVPTGRLPAQQAPAPQAATPQAPAQQAPAPQAPAQQAPAPQPPAQKPPAMPVGTGPTDSAPADPPLVSAPLPSQTPTPIPNRSAPSEGREHRRGPVTRQQVLIGAAVAFSALVLVLVLAAVHRSPSAREPMTEPVASKAPSPSCPAADDGCRVVRLTGSTVSTPAGRFHLDAGRDIMVLGRWACQETALPALLRPGTGQVWVFLRWATPSRPSTARPVGTFPGARSLRVLPAADGCDRLAVVRSGARTVVIHMARS